MPIVFFLQSIITFYIVFEGYVVIIFEIVIITVMWCSWDDVRATRETRSVMWRRRKAASRDAFVPALKCILQGPLAARRIGMIIH